MIRSLPPESVMDRIRREYRAECDAEATRDTKLQFGSSWHDTAALLWGDIVAAMVTMSEAPTAPRIEGQA